MEARWSGVSFGNGASAVATFTLDTSLFNNPGHNLFAGPTSPFLGSYVPISDAFQNFQMTMTGSALGDGVFTASDFSLASFSTNAGTLNFNSELVGQPVLNGLWGVSQGSFSLSPANGSAPLSPGDFDITARGLNGIPSERLLLTSFAPVSTAAPVAVPETSTWVMGFLALGAVVFMVRQRRLRN